MMGYVHDIDLSVMVPLGGEYTKFFNGSSTIRQVNGVWEYLKDYAAETMILRIPVVLPASQQTKRGVKLASIDFWYEIGTNALLSYAVEVLRFTLPDNGSAMGAPVSEAVTLEGSDLGAVGVRMMRVSIDTPFWLQAGEACQVELTAETPVDTEFYYYGARLNFTLRE